MQDEKIAEENVALDSTLEASIVGLEADVAALERMNENFVIANELLVDAYETLA